MERRFLKLKTILITHFHNDHIGGVEELQKYYSANVIGPLKEQARLPKLDMKVTDKEIVDLGFAQAEVLETPGHTLGSVCYYFYNEKALFTGDTLFSLGCGRLFEGTAEQMFNSLRRLSHLPETTLIYCGHEYTQSNGNFALTLYPDNKALQERMKIVNKLRNRNLPTIPVLLKEENETNPFILARNYMEFADFRSRKDHFK